MPRLTFNRTIVELNLDMNWIAFLEIVTFNRTIVELNPIFALA